jgi:oligopeptide/dipeptide ABC transporter ATP-binding protein
VILSVEALRVEVPVQGTLQPAVDGVSLALRAGESVAIVGESGCGKTQLARAILGLSPPGSRVSGRIVYAGRDLAGSSEREWRGIRGSQIGLVFQEPAAALDPVRSIGAQIVEAIRLHSGLSRDEARRLAVAALRDVGFPDPEASLGEYPHRLSGGLAQRAFLALTLAQNPKVLLADEPTASLDATVGARVLELIDGLRSRRGLGVLLISHDLGIVARHSDRVVVLYAGRVVEEAATPDLLRAPCHPYTRGLLASVPRISSAGRKTGQRYDAIPGALPDLSVRPRGACDFAPRCAERFDPCDRRVPDLYAAGGGRARCFLYEDGRVGVSE